MTCCNVFDLSWSHYLNEPGYSVSNDSVDKSDKSNAQKNEDNNSEHRVNNEFSATQSNLGKNPSTKIDFNEQNK